MRRSILNPSIIAPPNGAIEEICGPYPFPGLMKTCAATAMAIASIGMSRNTLAFLAGVPSRTTPCTASFISRRRAVQHIGCKAALTAPRADQQLRGMALRMVSTTFGEKINTDRIELDKTAAEAITDLYPEVISNNPTFLGAALI